MAQTNYTPIQLYYSTTAAAVPIAGNLANGELAINITDGKIYYKNNAGVVTLFGSTGDVSSVSFGTTGLTPSTATGGAITVAGTLVTANGGTGLSSFASGDIMYYSSGTAMSKLTIGSANQILTSTGTAPQWSTLTSVAVTTFSAGTTGFTPSTATSGAITLAGTLVVSNGGTGLTTLTAGYIPFGAGTSAFGNSADLFWDNTNARLGIGTSSPAYKLQVYGTDPAIGIQANAGTSDAWTIQAVGSDNRWRLVNNTSGSGEILTVLRTGNVGIGTSSPAARLDVSTTSAAGVFTTTQTSGNAVTINVDAGSGTPVGLRIQAGIATIGSTAKLISVIDSAGGNLFNVQASGNVGIGTGSLTSMLQVAGSSSVSALKTPNIAEVDTISATAATGTINYDITTQSVLFYTSNASANWTVNFRGSSGTTLNTLMQTGESISATFLVTQGSTAYYNSAVTIDGTSVTPKWQGGTAPTSGNASSVDCYTYVIQKTGSATYAVLASQTKFA